MDSNTSSNNKRIAKNTILLYLRMMLIMMISLYTSRVIIRTLGIVDYGIYNVVGGVVSMMGLLNSTMSVSTQRYLTFELGKGNIEKLKKTFNVSFQIYIILAIIFLLLAETIGLWFLNNKLVIPSDRMVAANWCFQFFCLSIVNTLFVNPFNACIIAHEKMGIYAYVSIIDVLLKLGIVYLICISPYDKLISYGLFYLFISFIITMIYRIYCLKKFPECQFKFYKDKALLKELLSYSGWNLFGSASSMVKGQGLNILLNLFFNPTVNAARGIAYQINAQVAHFFSNFYTAVRPQITKYYAQGDIINMFKLVFMSSKMAYYLILIISLPVVIDTQYIIDLWLGQTPNFVIPFVRIIMIITAIDSMANPLMTSVHATGKIALYQSTVGIITMLNIPISYWLLKFQICTSPNTVFIVSLILAIVNFFDRLWIVNRLLKFPVIRYIKEVVLNGIVVTCCSIVIPLSLSLLSNNSFVMHFCIIISSVISTIITIYFIGLNNDERQFIKKTITKKLNYKKNNSI